jgi:MoaA/NifB/PqqE/SkfB family radical SAM enzyme/glycosyltransferase involved in cell wall biosynthesis
MDRKSATLASSKARSLDMRIIHISTKKYHSCFSPSVFLQSIRHDVICIILEPCDDPQDNITSRYSEHGVRYVHVSVRKDFDLADDQGLESACSGLFKEFDPDIIHVQIFSGVNVRSILRASLGSFAKRIITLHDHSLFCTRGVCFDQGQVCLLNSLDECSCDVCRSAARRETLSLSEYNRARKGRCEEVMSLADAVICCSHWQRKVITRLFGYEEKTAVFYYGVEKPPRSKATVTRSEIEKAGIDWKSFVEKVIRNGWGEKTNALTVRFKEIADQDKDQVAEVFGKDFPKLLSALNKRRAHIRRISPLPTFGYLGSLAELKGVDVLLDAIQQLGQLKFQVLMAVFEPDNAKAIAQLKKLKGHPRIQVLTGLKTSDLDGKLFSQIDYLIIPSVWEETGPMTLFEAFFYKTPVIISRRPSLVEKTREGVNALIFDNADTLAQTMKNIVEGRLALKARGQEIFSVKTAEQYTAELESIYAGKKNSSGDRSLTLNLGSLCNNNCIFCVRGGNDSVMTVDLKVIKNMLEKHSGRYGSLKITGGEPTLRKDLPPILKLANKLGYKVTLETNARMLADAKLSLLIAPYHPEFMTHLESYKPSVHEGVTRAKGSFSQTVVGIKNVLKHGGTVSVKIMIAKHNYRDLLMLSKFIARLGAGHIVFVFLDPGGYAERFFDAIIPQYSEVRPHLSEALTWLMQNTKTRITLENFPLCCLDPSFREFESQQIRKERSQAIGFSPMRGKNEIYLCTTKRLKRKEKSPECRFCKFDAVCEGIYKRYIQSFGWQGIRPVSA